MVIRICKKKQVGCLVIFILILSSLNLYSQKKSKREKLEINFTHYVGDKLLVLDSSNYNNRLHQDFLVTKFKYYVGNISLKRKDGSEYLYKKYNLIDEEAPDSKRIIIYDIPMDEYVSLSFKIGVDSIDNCSGAQTDALDPIKGMFWTWNTGYIFMKLEGTSSFSTAPNNILEYHLGGFKKPHNYIKTITLPFTTSMFISKNRKNRIGIKVDLLEFFKSPNSIDFSKLPTVIDVNNTKTLVDNYVDMFSIITTIDEK